MRLSGDPGLAALHRELAGLPGGTDPRLPDGIAVPLRIRVGDAELAFLSTVTTFGTAVDVTAAEVSIEAFLPADDATTAAVRAASERCPYRPGQAPASPDGGRRPRTLPSADASHSRACSGEPGASACRAATCRSGRTSSTPASPISRRSAQVP